MNLPRWSLRFPVTSSMVLVCLVVLGLLSAPRLPLAFLPEVDFPALEISIPYPNALPAQVEEEIARPAEEALATMSRVRRIQSWSNPTGAQIYIQFDWGEDIGPLRVDAREKLDRIRDLLPRDVDIIQVNGFRSTDIPVLECRVSAERDLSQSYELLDRRVADPLRRVPGVAKVELYGVEPPQVLVEFSLDGLERHGLSAETVLARVEAANKSLSAGRLRNGDESWPLRVVNRFATLEEIGALPVDDRGLALREIAAISYREPDLDYGRHLDRTRAIGLNVIKESGANTVDVARRARQALLDIGQDPQMRGIQVLTFTDQAEEITNSLTGLLQSGLIGAVLAVIVLFFFLRNIITTLVVATAIPFSLLAASALMYFTGRTLNILSMMGLMLAVGMLVDNAVVVLESIYRRRQEGAGSLRAALAGSREVLPAVVCSTMTSVIVFLPLVLGGRTEITTWLGEVGRTIIFTLGCSLYLSLTAIPLALGRFLPISAPALPPKSLVWLTDRYEGALNWTLTHRPLAAGMAFLFFVASIAAFIPVNKSSFAGSKVEAVRLEYEFADNVHYLEAEKYVSRVEDWIAGRQDSLHIKSTYSFFTNNFAVTRAYLASGFADDEGSEKVRKMMRQGLPEMPGAKVKVRGNDDDEGGGSHISVNVFGDPGPRLDALAAEVKRRVTLVPGTDAVEIGSRKGSQEIEVLVDRDRAARYGLSASDVANSVALFFRGRPLSRFRGPDGEVQVQARLADADRNSLERLRGMPIAVEDAEETTVPLGSVASFRTVKTPQGIERQQRRSVVSVNADVDSKKRSDIRKAVTTDLKSMHFPPGYAWSFGSAFQEENETQVEMLLNLILALALVYVVMAALFESFLHPFAIMFALPFAFAGVAWMCLLTGTPFNLMAQIGLLILVGIVVNNGIVLLHHVHQLRQGGMPRHAALIRAGRDRLRPILMTTATTVLGLAPLALGGTNVGGTMYYPLARTVIGGLLSSTALTLVLVPCLYTLLEDAWFALARAWSGRGRVAGAAGAALSLLVLLVAAPAPVAARAGGNTTDLHRDIVRTFAIEGARRIDLHAGVGEVEVIGEDRADVVVEIHLADDGDDGDDEDAFERRVRDYDAVARRAGDRLRVEIRSPRMRWHRNIDVSVIVRVPRRMPLEVDMAVGSLSVRGVERSVRLQLGIGEVDLRVPALGVRDVRVTLAIGEASLATGGGRLVESTSVFGGGLKWSEGRGAAPVSVRLGIGEVAVILD